MEQEEIKQEVAVKKPSLKNEVALAIKDKGISDTILRNFNELVSEGQLKFPSNYNVGNQLKLAYLSITQNQAAKHCTPVSIGQALTEFALQGLEIDKKQAYFIPYGNQLQLFRSYFGDVAVAYRTGLVKDIKSIVIYQGDEIETEIVNDLEIVSRHTTSFLNRNNPIIGAYAVATLPNGEKRYCIMTKNEIDMSWSKAKTKNVQKDFPQEMAKRTVIRRLVKMLFNSANTEDNYVSSVIASYNRTTEDEYENNEPKQVSTTETNVVNTIIDDDELEELEDTGEVQEDFSELDQDNPF